MKGIVGTLIAIHLGLQIVIVSMRGLHIFHHSLCCVRCSVNQSHSGATYVATICSRCCTRIQSSGRSLYKLTFSSQCYNYIPMLRYTSYFLVICSVCRRSRMEIGLQLLTFESLQTGTHSLFGCMRAWYITIVM